MHGNTWKWKRNGPETLGYSKCWSKIEDYSSTELPQETRKKIRNNLFQWHKHRHIDRWNGIENPEMDPQMYGQLIFNKAGKNTQWEKGSSANDVGKPGQQHAE